MEDKSSYIFLKQKRAYDLYKQGRFFEKVYAAVQKKHKYLVLKNKPGSKYKFSLAGGGIEDGEDTGTAIKRELAEELNIEVEVIKELGTFYMGVPYEFNGESFISKYRCKVVLTRFISFNGENKFGLEGEFDPAMGMAEISKKEMLNNVYEFTCGGIKL